MEITERNGVPRRRYEISKARLIEHAMRDPETILVEEERAAELSFDNVSLWNGLRYEYMQYGYSTRSRFQFSMKYQIDVTVSVAAFVRMNEAAAWLLAYDAKRNTQGGNDGQAAAETE